MKLTWKNVFNGNLGSFTHSSKAAAAAKHSGYEYFAWGGDVFTIQMAHDGWKALSHVCHINELDKGFVDWPKPERFEWHREVGDIRSLEQAGQTWLWMMLTSQHIETCGGDQGYELLLLHGAPVLVTMNTDDTYHTVTLGENQRLLIPKDMRFSLVKPDNSAGASLLFCREAK